MSKINITELLGDGIGPELRESVYAIVDALPLKFNFIPSISPNTHWLCEG